MADFRYFVECDGKAVQLRQVYHEGQRTRPQDFVGTCECGERHRAQRRIEYKAFARRHECDSRCLNATGKVMRCECACGGKNHGRGNLCAQ